MTSSNANNYIIDRTWVSGSQVLNYMQGTPLDDWLEEYARDALNTSDDKVLEVLKRICNVTTPVTLLTVDQQTTVKAGRHTFLPEGPENDCAFGSRPTKAARTGSGFGSGADRDLLLNQGVEFEEALVSTIERMKRLHIVRIKGDFTNANDPAKFSLTLDAMRAGVDVIHAGVLHDPVTKTKGVPDLLVRSDKMHLLVEKSPLTPVEQKIKAPFCTGDYHYCVIDIKWSSLAMTADGIHLLNQGFFKAHKAQVFIYNRILAGIQGYDSGKAFLLGRRYKWGDTVKESALARLGTVSFNGHDSDIPAKADAAIKWLRDVRRDGARWNVLVSPLPRPELYPNMRVTVDEKWNNVKSVIARAIGEITLLWNCGQRERSKAHAAGVYSLRDKRFSLDLIEMTNPTKRASIEQMLQYIHNPLPTGLNEVVTSPREENLGQSLQLTEDSKLLSPAKLELFVDFEGICRTIQDFSKLPACVTTNMIYWIGCVFRNPVSRRWEYKRFVAEYLTVDEEERICRDFVTFVRDLKKSCKVERAQIFHWSQAEMTMWEAAHRRISSANQTVKNGRSLRKRDREEFEEDFGLLACEWTDLHRIFKEESIVIPGCNGFGLKEVARAFASYGLIKSHWDDANMCPSGFLASAATALMSKQGGKISEMSFFERISRYNEVDCRVMQEIVQALRSIQTA